MKNRRIPATPTPAQQAENDAKRAEYLDREFAVAIEMVAEVWPTAVVTRVEPTVMDFVANVSHDGENIRLRAPVEKVNLHVALIDARTWRRKQEELAALTPAQRAERAADQRRRQAEVMSQDFSDRAEYERLSRE